MPELILEKWDKVVIVFDPRDKKILDFDMDSPDEMKQIAQVLHFEPGHAVLMLLAQPDKGRVVHVTGDDIGCQVKFHSH